MRVKSYNGRFKVFGTRTKYFRYEESKSVIAGIQADVILTTDQKLAADYLVGMEINNGLWSKNGALYGMLGGTSSTHKWNWKTMLNTDAGGRIVWNGGITHGLNGAKGDGSTGYADTKYSSSLISKTSHHLAFYTNSNVNELGQDIGTVGVDLYARQSGMFTFPSGGTLASRSVPTSSGMSLGSRASSASVTLYKNGNNLVTAIGSVVNIPSIPQNIYLFALLNNSPVQLIRFSSKNCGFASIGDGLIESEAIIKSNIVINYNKILNRA